MSHMFSLNVAALYVACVDDNDSTLLHLRISAMQLLDQQIVIALKTEVKLITFVLATFDDLRDFSMFLRNALCSLEVFESNSSASDRSIARMPDGVIIIRANPPYFHIIDLFPGR